MYQNCKKKEMCVCVYVFIYVCIYVKREYIMEQPQLIYSHFEDCSQPF